MFLTVPEYEGSDEPLCGREQPPSATRSPIRNDAPRGSDFRLKPPFCHRRDVTGAHAIPRLKARAGERVKAVSSETLTGWPLAGAAESESWAAAACRLRWFAMLLQPLRVISSRLARGRFSVRQSQVD